MKYRVILLSLILFAILISVFFIFGQQKQVNLEYVKYFDNSIEDERTYIEDEFADERFEEMYSLNNIEKHNVYIVDKELCVNIFFDPNITRSEILKAKDFFGKLVYEKGMKYGALPYESLYIQKETFDTATLRIFIDEEILIYINYKFGSEFHDYYENMSINLDCRKIDNQNIELYKKQVTEELSFIQDITVIKPFKPYVFLFKITTNKVLKENEINVLKECIEKNIALNLEKDVLDLYGANTNSLGIIIDLYANKNNYKELVFFNGYDKKWIEVDWIKTDFFKMNL